VKKPSIVLDLYIPQVGSVRRRLVLETAFLEDLIQRFRLEAVDQQ